MDIRIRRRQLSDAAAIARLVAEPAVFGGLLQMPYASEEQWQHRLQESAKAGHALPDVHLVAERGEELLGCVGLHPITGQTRRRHVAEMGIMVASRAQGQGVGAALMAALLDYADNWAQVLRIELTVYADNARAIRLYQRFGFVEEGRMPAYALRDGAYVTALAMGRLHPSPPMIR